MIKIYMKYTRETCKNKNNTPLDIYCEGCDLAGEDENSHVSCPFLADSTSACLSVEAHSVDFSGVSYANDRHPLWTITVDDRKFTSYYCTLEKLIVDGEIVYDIDRDDVHRWIALHKSFCDDILRMEAHDKNQNPEDRNFTAQKVEDYAYHENVTLPCSGGLLISALGICEHIGNPIIEYGENQFQPDLNRLY